MTKKKEIDQTKFEKLLVWLNADRDEAGQKYESIRRRLIYIFLQRGCLMPEDLADETIDRVTQKIENLAEDYEGDPALYFYSVARHIIFEYFRRPQPEELSEFIIQETSLNRPDERSNCLVICLQTLTEEKQKLFIEYYRTDQNNHIAHRKQLAIRLGISEGNLRKKIFRLKGTLHNCLLKCLAKKKG
jgi:RNA polymerase sigma factor (sigma-70 family)